MFDHSQKSRIRLRVEVNLSAFVMCAGGLLMLFGHLLVGLPAMFAGLYYMSGVSKEFKTRTNLLGEKEKTVMFRIDAIGFSIMYVAFVAWLFPIRTPVAWCLFGLATFVAPIAIYASWTSVFSDASAEEEKAPNQPTETTRGK